MYKNLTATKNIVKLPTDYSDYKFKQITWGEGQGAAPVFFCGMDIIESEELLLEVAVKLKKIFAEKNLPWVLKCSFDKANRSSVKSYRGPGIEKGLKILANIKQKVSVPIITDIHAPEQAEVVAQVADVLQIPAFLSRQTDLLVAAGKTNKVINVKKGQFLAPWDMKTVAEKIASTGNNKILLCERGTQFGYNRLVVDFTSLVYMRNLGYPVIMDCTHAVQLPGGLGESSGGNREMIPVIARAASAVGVDGFFFECHPNPDQALCDGPNALFLDNLSSLLDSLVL